MSRIYTLSADVIRERPHTNITSSPHINGSQIQWRFGAFPDKNTSPIKRPIWINRCKQFESTAASGMISRGAGTRLIRPALSTSEVVPELQVMLKKLKGTKPHITNRAKSGLGFLSILVKTNVSTPIITRGFKSDQSIPSDMLR